MAGGWLSLCNLVSFTRKTDFKDITEVLLNVALKTHDNDIIHIYEDILTGWEKKQKRNRKDFFYPYYK